MTTDTTKAALADILASAQSSGCAHNNGAGGQYLLCATEPQLLKFADLLRANAAVVPEGWKLMPPEADDAMLTAATRASMAHLIECINDPAKAKLVGSDEMCKLTYASRYRSMFAAAPSAPVLAEPAFNTRLVQFVGVNPLGLTDGAARPMLLDSWRFGFSEVDGVLRFGSMDTGPLVAVQAVHDEQDARLVARGMERLREGATTQPAPQAQGVEGWGHLKQYGYAPGNYMGKCSDCLEIKHDLDKRAIRCRECAEVRACTPPSPVAQPEALPSRSRIAESDRQAGLTLTGEALPVQGGEDAALLDYLQVTGSTVEILPGDDGTWRFRVGGLHSAVSNNIRTAIYAASVLATPPRSPAHD